MKRCSLALVGVALVVVQGCEQAPQPVAEVSVEPTELSLPYPSHASLRLSWNMLDPLGAVEGQPLVFVHLLDEPGNVVRTFDHVLPHDWQPGQSRSYEITLYQSGLAPPLDDGVYQLSLGLYDRSGRRWALRTAGEEVADLEYRLAQVRSESVVTEVPMFYFSPSWLPLEVGTDVQILGRRWLTGEGKIRVVGIPSEGVIWMLLRIPTAEPELEELALQPGQDEPGVLVAGTCGAEEHNLSGVGLHEVRLALRNDDESEVGWECEIELLPNFHIVEVKTLARRSLALEILAWSGSQLP